MATMKDITSQLKDFLEKADNFATVSFTKEDKAVIQKLNGKGKNAIPSLCLWTKQYDGVRSKGIRTFDLAEFKAIKEVFNNPNTEKIIKILEKVNPKRENKPTNKPMKKLKMPE